MSKIKRLVFATGNKHKVQEVSAILGDGLLLEDLQSIGCLEEIPETQDTIEGNAVQKATYVFDHYQLDCFAEDTGLEVAALNGAPGVKSARYAGPERNDQQNMDLLIKNLEKQADRRARFKTVIALIQGGKVKTFEGIVNGIILKERRGSEGFGYDPIFQPDGYQQSFAELGKEVKNKISHRAIAVSKLIKYLQGATGYN